MSATVGSPSQSTSTLDTEVVESPLYMSLLYSVRSPGALTADAVSEENIPSHMNPRPLKTYMDDGAEYWVDGDGSLLRMKFPARLDLTGQYSRIGPYFNMLATRLDPTALKKARAQFELRPLDESDPNSGHYPQEALDCSSRALKTLFALTNEVNACNALIDSIEQSKRPGITNFWKTYTEEDRYSLIVQSDPLFYDLPGQRPPAIPPMNRDDIEFGGLPIPSEMTSAQESDGEHLRLCDLFDPDSRYSDLAKIAALGDTKVNSPDVRNEDGVLINVGDYKTKLQNGDVVEVEVILRLWNITPNMRAPPNSRDATGSRIYQLILRRMQLLPCSAYMGEALSDPKGKRKAAGEPTGTEQSTITRGIFNMMEIDE